MKRFVAVVIFIGLIIPSIAGAQGYVRRSVGIVIKNSGVRQYSEDELRECLTQVFSKSYTTYAKFLRGLSAYDRFTLQKAGRENHVSSVLLIDIKEGKTPWLMVRNIDAKTSKSRSKIYPLDGAWGGLCDTAFFAAQESFSDEPAGEIARAMAQGDQQLKEGSGDNALAWYQHAVDLDPYDPAPPLKLARYYRDIGNASEALRWYSVSLSQKSDDPWAYLEAANLALDSGQLKRAIQYYEFAINSGSGAPRLFKSIGDLYHSQGQYGLAVQSYKEALQLEPSDRSIYPKLVSALMMEDSYLEAMKYQSLICAESKTIDNVRRMAYLAERAGEYRKASEVLAEWLALAPDSDDIKRRLAESYDNSGQIEKALELLHQLKDKYPEDVRLLRAIGKIYYRKKDYAGAIAILQEARAVDPADTEALRLEAMTREFSGDVDAALELYFLALRYDETVRGSDIARILAFGEKYDRRAEVKSRLNALSSGKGLDDRRVIVMALGQKYVEEGNIDAAIRVYESALSSLRRYAPAYLALGDLYLRAGQKDKAVNLFYDALVRFSDSKIPLYAATHLHMAGDFEDAKGFYYYALDRNPGNAGVAVAIAEIVLFTEQDYDHVNRYFHVALEGRLSEPLLERLYFLEIVWGKLADEEQFADGVLKYAVTVIAENPNRRIDLTYWDNWIKEKFDGDDQAFMLDVLGLFEGKIACEDFSKKHPAI